MSWVVPSGAVSEHPPAPVSYGQSYVTSLDQRGDEEPRLGLDRDLPRLGRLGRLLRPRRAADGRRERLRAAGAGHRHQPLREDAAYIDHQTLSFDAYDKFIEDDFLDGQRLNPATDGRPDPRPDVREDEKILGNLVDDFDFDQTPAGPGRPPGPPEDHPHRHAEPSQLSAAAKAPDTDG